MGRLSWAIPWECRPVMGSGRSEAGDNATRGVFYLTSAFGGAGRLAALSGRRRGVWPIEMGALSVGGFAFGGPHVAR